MRWPFTVTDPLSPFFLVLLKSLDVITTFIIVYNPVIFDLREGNVVAEYLFYKIGYVQTTILYSLVVYILGRYMRSYYYSDSRFSKIGAQLCYNFYVFVFIGVAIWNYYNVVDSWRFWYLL